MASTPSTLRMSATESTAAVDSIWTVTLMVSPARQAPPEPITDRGPITTTPPGSAVAGVPAIAPEVQIESEAAVAAVENILAVDGVDAIFIGPSDLAASMGLLGEQEHPGVRAAVEHCLAAAKAAGKPAGVNAFNEATARAYLDAGASFVLVGADVAMLARGTEALAAKFIPASGQGEGPDGGARPSY